MVSTNVEKLESVGFIKSVRDSVIVIKGLEGVGVNEMITMFPKAKTIKELFEKNKAIQGVVLNLEQGLVKALAFAPDYKIKKG
jgi:F0F1-type ATP synthase alpha subunit